MSPSVSIDKSELRPVFLNARRSLAKGSRKGMDRIITSRLISRPEIIASVITCLYCSSPDEVDTHAGILALLRTGKRIAVPDSTAKDPLVREILSLRDLDTGPYGILIPRPACPTVRQGDISCFVVPGVAFDPQCYRLGRGGGYYDRLLSGLTASKIGLSYSCQILPRLPKSSYDIPMDVVITDTEVYERPE